MVLTEPELTEPELTEPELTEPELTEVFHVSEVVEELLDAPRELVSVYPRRQNLVWNPLVSRSTLEIWR